MKKHIRTLSVVPLAALAVSVCALYPTKTEIFTREPIDYKNAAVRLTAPSEPDTSAENITDPKSAVLDKVLNTIDRLDRVCMTARTNMIGDGETTLDLRRRHIRRTVTSERREKRRDRLRDIFRHEHGNGQYRPQDKSIHTGLSAGVHPERHAVHPA